MASNKSREESRLVRKKRVRKAIKGTDSKPRLCVYRSLKFTYAQFISDETGTVLGQASTREATATGKSAKSVDSAKELGTKMAQIAKEKKIDAVVFDRNGYLYHGRVRAVAEGAREAGLHC